MEISIYERIAKLKLTELFACDLCNLCCLSVEGPHESPVLMLCWIDFMNRFESLMFGSNIEMEAGMFGSRV